MAIAYRDSEQDYGAIGLYSAYAELNSIYRKVRRHWTRAVSGIIHAQDKFNLEVLYEEHPEIKSSIGRGGREKRLTTSIFALTEIFRPVQETNEHVGILGLIKNVRTIRYVNRKYLADDGNLGYYKVIVPKSNGSGAIGEVLSTPLIGVTQSFITIGHFKTGAEAEAAIKYVKTKFARALLGILKVTQDNSREVWNCVPIQDFTPASDIDWSKPVADIDRQLYAKYGLTGDEIAFIESVVKPM